MKSDDRTLSHIAQQMLIASLELGDVAKVAKDLGVTTDLAQSLANGDSTSRVYAQAIEVNLSCRARCKASATVATKRFNCATTFNLDGDDS